MFSLFSGVYDAYLAPTKLNLLIVGAGGVGKTALLERLKCTQFTKNKKIEKQQVAEYLQREVPGSFLAPKPRAASNQSSNYDSPQRPPPPPPQGKQKAAAAATKEMNKKAEAGTIRFGFLKCPAPSRYQNTQQDSDSDEEKTSIADGHDTEETTPPKPVRNGLDRPETSQDSMRDVSLKEDGDDDDAEHVAEVTISKRTSTATAPPNSIDHQQEAAEDDQQQCDVKPKSKMLPLHKIRPTIGMNLAKVDICSAQCSVWDVGGKMHDLWSRYYQDCDAVIFVWKIVEEIDNNAQEQKKKDGDDDSDDEDYPFVSAAEQLVLLEQVRKSIPDDIPFLIWGHWFPTVPRKNKMYTFNVPYSTGSVLPHYHNPLMSLYFGSAKSGAGVRQAMEWLIPIAARQKKLREKAALDAKEAEEAKDEEE